MSPDEEFATNVATLSHDERCQQTIRIMCTFIRFSEDMFHLMLPVASVSRPAEVGSEYAQQDYMTQCRQYIHHAGECYIRLFRFYIVRTVALAWS